MKIYSLAFALVVLAPATGCFVSARPVGVEVDYQPMYYEGEVVYYDDGGAPFYYAGTEVRYVPATYVNYRVLTTHYHDHGPAYRRWHESHPRQQRSRHR